MKKVIIITLFQYNCKMTVLICHVVENFFFEEIGKITMDFIESYVCSSKTRDHRPHTSVDTFLVSLETCCVKTHSTGETD